MSHSLLISAVIPTRNRPDLLHRAILSALNQTYSHLEVIVVIDGEDAATLTFLSGLDDPRVNVIPLAQSVGGAEARNIGARAARGQWVAFLDDDDEWLPTKLEKQLAAAEAILGDYVFVASRYIERSESGDRTLPSRSLEYEGLFSDFLFCRDKIGGGTGYVQTSTWFVSKALLEVAPFTKGLKRNQDVDWMLHAMAVPDCKLKILEEPLSIFHEDKRSGRVSKQPDWKFHYDWAVRNRAFLSPKAFSFCMATLCVPEAVRQHAPLSTFLKLLKEALLNGQITANCLFFFLYNWWFPENLRQARRMRAASFRTA